MPLYELLSQLPAGQTHSLSMPCRLRKSRVGKLVFIVVKLYLKEGREQMLRTLFFVNCPQYVFNHVRSFCADCEK